ncbi:MAG: DUF6526 family protein [Gemmatimonadaceae bacterium]|nr:DUF6526 family protein [Gemmatimonadaceae bacterium]
MSQTYQTHRNFPRYYFGVAVPATWIALMLAIWACYRRPALETAVLVVLALALLLVLLVARVMANRVQDRIIRLEMRLRLREVLPAALLPRTSALSTRQLVGLRFASDAELPALVERCLAGELANGEAVKRQIRDWQPDYLRA